MLFYYRCKYVLDFYIVLFLSMLSQAVVFNKIFNLLYKRLIFIHVASQNSPFDVIVIQGDYNNLQSQNMSRLMLCYLAEIEGRLT